MERQRGEGEGKRGIKGARGIKKKCRKAEREEVQKKKKKGGEGKTWIIEFVHRAIFSACTRSV